MTTTHHLTRRHWVAGTAALALPSAVLAQATQAINPVAKSALVGPLAPNPAEFRKLMEQFTGG